MSDLGGGGAQGTGPEGAPERQLDAGARPPPEPEAGARPAHRRRHRVVLWVSLSVAAIVAVLLAVLASAGPASQVRASSPLIGKAAPPVSGPSITGGGRVSLSRYAGKWVLVNFAASWCVPCREEMPQLLEFSRQHAKAGNAVVLTVAYDTGDVPNLAAFLRSQGATWPAVNDAQAEVSYGVGGLPESYLVDPSGTVVAKYLSGVDAAQLDELIASVSPAGP